MSQSWARVILHVVFSTKNRAPFLKHLELRERLHAYMAGVVQHLGCEPILINGVEDHVHILCNLSAPWSWPSWWRKRKRIPYDG
jgi:putative transposase